MPEEKKEPEFTVIDRRKSGLVEQQDEKKEVNPSPEVKQVDSAQAEVSVESPEISPEQGEETDVASLLKWFTELLYGNALLWMGLVAHPQTGRTMKDMKQAKLAIDTLDFLCGRLSVEHLSEMEKKNFLSMLSGLKIEFVNQSKVF